MKEQDHISPGQWAFTACCFLMGTIMRSGFINYIMDNESWMIGAFGAVAFLPILAGYQALYRRYPGMNLFEIAETALGVVMGKIVSIGLCVFYLMLATVNLMEIGSFVTAYLLQGTPFLAATMLAALTAAYVLTKGMGALTRLVPVITITACMMLLISFGQSISVSNLNNLLPVFNKPAGSYVHATIFAVAVPYCESVTMFALLPMVGGGKTREMHRSTVTVYVFTSIVMLLVHIRETATLGSLLTYTAQPTYEVMRMIDSGATLARTESLFAMELLTLSFIKVTLILFALIRGIAHVTGIERTGEQGIKHKAIALPVCILAAAYAATFRDTPYNNTEWFVNVAPIIWLFFEAVIPMFMLVAGILKARKAARAATT